MICLALDASTEACSAALLTGDALIARYELAPRRHAELLLPMVDAVLTDAGVALADCDVLAFGRGPGAFTGLRIAAGVAQGLAFAAALPVAPVSTLAALALAARDDALGDAAGNAGGVTVAAAIDARMGEVYWGVYRLSGDDILGTALLLQQEQVCAPDAVALPGIATCIGIGSGWGAHGETLTARCRRAGVSVRPVLPQRYPRAAEIARLGRALHAAGGSVEATRALPVYLRDRITRPPS